MKIPHKWPGRVEFLAMVSAMRLLDPSSVMLNWRDMPKVSSSQLKRHYRYYAHRMEFVIQHQQKGKDNG